MTNAQARLPSEFLGGNGDSDTATLYSGGSFYFGYAYPDDDPTGTPSDPYTITIEAEDSSGNTASQTSTITIKNVDPTISLGQLSGDRPKAGQTVTLTATAYDASANDVLEVIADWGDGATDTLAGGTPPVAIEANHAYTKVGDFTIAVIVADDDGGTATETRSITVLPEVSIAASDALAREVGPKTGTFTVSRTGSTDDPLSVKFLIGGSATNGTDYSKIPSTISIPAGSSSATIVITPVTDTILEGIEDVVLVVDVSDDYLVALGEGDAKVDIRDRAAVQKVFATAGIRNLPADGTGRPVGGGQLHLTQDDSVSFKAIPTDGGDFAPNDITWTVTGEPASSGESRTVTFNTFRSTGTTVSASTPVNSSPVVVTTRIVPYPTAVAGVTVGSFAPHYLPNFYGADFDYHLSPSNGATADDLIAAANAAELFLWRSVDGSLPKAVGVVPCPTSPTSYVAAIRNRLVRFNNEFQLSTYGVPQTPQTLQESESFSWESHAIDSPRFAHENTLLADNLVTWVVQTSANGYVVRTTTLGTVLSQPFISASPFAVIPVGGTTSSPPPVSSGTFTMTFYGTVTLTAADIALGSKTFTVSIYDDDSLGDDWLGMDTLLDTVTLTVPAVNGLAGAETPFKGSVVLTNSGGYVAGSIGSSGESSAEVYFVTPAPASLRSNTVTVNVSN